MAENIMPCIDFQSIIVGIDGTCTRDKHIIDNLTNFDHLAYFYP